MNSYLVGPVLTITEAVEEIRLEATGAANLLSTAETPMQQLALVCDRTRKVSKACLVKAAKRRA
jgi:hypothetical protein